MLDTTTPLNGYSIEINDISIKELSSVDIVSIAIPHGKATALSTVMKKEFGVALPPSGQFTSDKNKTTKLLWLSPDQLFLLTTDLTLEPAKTVKNTLGNNAYVTNQSDSFAILEVSGKRAIEAMERICPVNLHPEKFKTGSVARTVMEHLGVIILKSESDKWVLMSARSSAQSFLHAVETSAKNI